MTPYTSTRHPSILHGKYLLIESPLWAVLGKGRGKTPPGKSLATQGPQMKRVGDTRCDITVADLRRTSGRDLFRKLELACSLFRQVRLGEETPK